jgi:ribosomal protein L40E
MGNPMPRPCYQCGADYPLKGGPGRLETCDRCGTDWHVCLNCIHYDPKVAEQCRERRAELVTQKHLANFCEYFELKRREWKPVADPLAHREVSARDTFKKLLGD